MFDTTGFTLFPIRVQLVLQLAMLRAMMQTRRSWPLWSIWLEVAITRRRRLRVLTGSDGEQRRMHLA